MVQISLISSFFFTLQVPRNGSLTRLRWHSCIKVFLVLVEVELDHWFYFLSIDLWFDLPGSLVTASIFVAMQPNGRTIEVAEEEVVRTPRSVTAKQPVETDKKNEKVSLGAYDIRLLIKRVTYKMLHIHRPTPPFKED